MWIESFIPSENTEIKNDSLLKQRENFDLEWYWIELRNKQERIKLLEDREWELEWLENLLIQNPNTKKFFIFEWKHYPNNPIIDIPREPLEIVYLQIETREEIQERINILEESITEDKVINITEKIDDLIDNDFYNNQNVRNLLIELRIWLSWFEQSSYLSWAESINTMLHLLEKFETEIPSISEVLKMLWHWFNIIRYIPHYWTKAWIWFLKEVTSNRLHWFWNKQAPLEWWLENNIVWNNYIPDSLEPPVLQVAKLPWASVAWWIDWALDFIQAYVDIKVVPDKVILWLIDIIPFIYDNFTELGWLMIEWIEETSDVVYILAYVTAVIFLTVKIDQWAWILTIPKVVWELLKKSWISAKIIVQIQKNILVHINKINTKVTKVITSSKTLSWRAWWIRDFADNTNTAMQRFKWVSDKLANSRKVLNTLNKTTILVNIFWEKIQWQLDNKNNTDIALQVYEEQILKWNWFVLWELEEQIENSSWELQYNLIRIREKFDEMKEVFEREIFPVKDKRDKFKMNGNLVQLAKIDKYYKSKFWEMNELSKLILSKYILGK